LRFSDKIFNRFIEKVNINLDKILNYNEEKIDSLYSVLVEILHTRSYLKLRNIS